MRSKAGAQARMPVATYGWEVGVAEQKINPACSAELVCAWWRQAGLS